MTDHHDERPLALVTGASSGIGLELARVFAENGFDLVIAAEDQGIHTAASELRSGGTNVQPVQADLATTAGVQSLYDSVRLMGRAVDSAAINAGVGVGGRFHETPLEDHLNLINLNITGAVHLAGLLLPEMVQRRHGRILFTSSIAAAMPGPYESTYAASKAFLYSFSLALRNELKDDGVTVTALMPGPTDTNFFERADLTDSMVGRAKKDDAAEVARDGYEALMSGEDHVVAGSFKNKAQVAAATVLPDTAAAAMHGSMAKPRSSD
ncbi:MAG TPA: SDR family NAD(P)-dependent oxidoreductase [Ilumatobacteraceae bacterium]